MTTPESSTYRFAEFELQPDERRLLRDSQPVPLTPKLFDMLEFLVLRGGHVVSKEELLNALWPNRFVMESNLTKHIWMLRKALGENGEGERFIETVSKFGYRFVAPVTRHAHAPESVAILTPVGTSPRGGKVPSTTAIPKWSFRAGASVTVLFACVALAAWWLWNGRQPTFPWSANPPGTVIAIVEFANLSKDPRNAWIGPAFEEMLATEIAVGGRLHPVPGELVRAARERLPDPDAGGFAPDTLARLRQRLAADYIVSGSYLTSARSGNPPVRLDFAVQDARNGTTIANFTRSGSTSDLPALITVVGSDLRARLGVKPQNPEELHSVANARPPTLDVMRRIGFALDALHHYEPAHARDELLQAIAQAPDYAPAYAYLSKAWAAMGYHDKALAAANQAAANASGLPPSMRLQIEAQDFEARYDWKHAIESLRKLLALRKNDPEVQLELIDVLLSAGKPKDAQVALDTLRTQTESMSADARVELAAGRIADAQENPAAEQAHAERALALAKARDNPGLVADSELILGTVFTPINAKKARDMFSRALVDYATVKNPHGEASVHLVTGNLLSDTQPKLARTEYEESLREFQAIGDRSGIASAYSDLGVMLWSAGDRDAAETAVRNVLEIRRETGDTAGQAWALTALAVEESDERASSEVIAAFRQAAALDASIGVHSHRGFTLYSLSDIFRLRGELEEARNACAEAQAEYAKVNGPANKPSADFECALIALDRGDVVAAEAGARHARDAAVRRGDTMMIANADLTLGQIKIGQGRWSDAAPLFDAAAREYAQGELTPGQAIAISFTALCAAAAGNARARDAAMARAVEIRSRINEHQEVIQVDINLAELRGEEGENDRAISALQAIADDARSRNWPAWAMEAELAELRVLLRNGDVARADALRQRLVVEAMQKGFHWVLARAQKP